MRVRIERMMLVLGLLTGAWRADAASIVVDQEYVPRTFDVKWFIGNVQPFGQAFTPTLTGIDWATFYFRAFAPRRSTDRTRSISARAT